MTSRYTALGKASTIAGVKKDKGLETPEQRVSRLQRELDDLVMRERDDKLRVSGTGGRSGYSALYGSAPGKVVSRSRAPDARQLRRQYEEELSKMQLQLRQQYILAVERHRLTYQKQALALAQERQEQVERMRLIQALSRDADDNKISVVTVSAIPGMRVTEVFGTVVGGHAMELLPEDATEAEMREAPVIARREAFADILIEARKVGANAIVNFKWRFSAATYDVVEVTAEGTALKVESLKQDKGCKECAKKGGGKEHKHDGKKKGKHKHDSDSEESSSDDDDGEDDEGNQNKKNKGKNKSGNNQKDSGGGKSGNNLSQTEALIKLLMESKIKEDRQTKAERQKTEFMNTLQKFFEDQQKFSSNKPDSSLDWTKTYAEDKEKAKGGKEKKDDAAWASTSGTATNAWGTSNDQNSNKTVGWGDDDRGADVQGKGKEAQTAGGDEWGASSNSKQQSPANTKAGTQQIKGQQKQDKGKGKGKEKAKPDSAVGTSASTSVGGGGWGAEEPVASSSSAQPADDDAWGVTTDNKSDDRRPARSTDNAWAGAEAW